MKPIKIIQFVPNLRICNGVTSFVMNYYANIDPSKVQIDFALFNDVSTPYYGEVKKRGGKVYILPELKKPFLFFYELNDILSNGYNAIHCHTYNSSIPVLAIAKLKGIPVRILHSHVTASSDLKWKKIRNDMFIPLARNFANQYFACTSQAGRELFSTQKFMVIPNAIDISSFLWNPTKRQKIRKSLRIENQFVIGSVGRLTQQKNPIFAMDIFSEVVKREPGSILIWVGTGPMNNQIKKYVKSKGLENSVFFLGDRSDINDLYQAMDVLFLPSLYEGLGIVFIEAQVAGLPAVGSTEVPEDTEITKLMHRVPLAADKKEWVDQILAAKGVERKDQKMAIENAGYSIVKESDKLWDTYRKLYEKWSRIYL